MTTVVPSADGEAFDPDALQAMCVAFEEVCRALQLEKDQHAREVMAVRIIDLVRGGERDAERLRDRVLREAGAMSTAVSQEPVRP